MSFLPRILASLSVSRCPVRENEDAALALGRVDDVAERLFSSLGTRWSPLTEVDEARIVIEDALTVLPRDQISGVLGRALLDLYGPSFTEEVGSALGRMAHFRARADLADVLREVEGQ